MIPEFNGDFIQWLRGFYYTALTGSMTAAAEQMKRNQSAITHQIKSLEEELGVKLFTGTKAKRSLTKSGRHLLAKAEQIFGLVSEVVDSVGMVEEMLAGEITISAFFTMMEYYLPDKMAEFSRRNPDVSIRMTGSSDLDSVFEKIYSREYDCGMLSIGSIPSEFLVDELFVSDVVLVSPPEGPWAVKHLPTLERLSRLPFISHPDNSSLEPYLRHHFSRLGLTFKPKHMVSHCGAIKEYVARGFGVAFLDRFICQPGDYGRMNVVSMESFFPNRSFGIVRRRETYVPAHVEAFVGYLLENSSCPTLAGISLPADEHVRGADGMVVP